MEENITSEQKIFLDKITELLHESKDIGIECILMARVHAPEKNGSYVSGGMSGTLEGMIDLFDSMFKENIELFHIVLKMQLIELLNRLSPIEDHEVSNKLPC